MVIMNQYEDMFYMSSAVVGAYSSVDKQARQGESAYAVMLILKDGGKAAPIGRYDTREQAGVAVGRLANAISDGECEKFRMPWPAEVNVQRSVSSNSTGRRKSHGGS